MPLLWAARDMLPVMSVPNETQYLQLKLAACMQLIYGGRNEVDYFDDLWAYDVEFKSWERWLEPGSGGPMGRDHHAAVVVGNQFIIYGERSPLTKHGPFRPSSASC